jgi:23S rRNA (cytosine1962-C5)-methyltransferase
MSSLSDLLRAALERRAALIAALEAEGTGCYRLLHGAVEGRPGLTVDAYGAHVLVQTFREPLGPGELDALRALCPAPVFYNHRGKPPLYDASPGALEPGEGRELGLRYRVQAHHRGEDPLLFLDLRAGRRWVRANAAGAAVLNLFAYTCGVGVAAAAGGAAEVLNVDFSERALAVGRENAALNPEAVSGTRFEVARADVIPTLRQLAGLPIKGRAARRPYRRFEARRFELVVLDPPTWATSPFGAVDLVRDYPALFKPALLACAPGGRVLATNHVSTVAMEDWLATLRRAAEKAGRPLSGIEVLAPEEDFPSPDGRHPLKIAICEVGAA